jgi:hypothetical protein
MTDFLSNDNKKIIWDILYENKLFKSYVDKDVLSVKNVLDNTINNVNTNNTNTSLMEKNKFVIQEIINKCKNKELITEIPSNLITKNEIIKHKQTEFEKELKKKEDDFFNSVKKNIPESINFSDNIDKPLDNIDELVNKHIASRNYDIQQISKDISNNTNIVIESNKDDKNVKWDLSNNEYFPIQDDDIFSKLKPLNNDTLDINTVITNLDNKINMIIENQQKLFKVISSLNR